MKKKYKKAYEFTGKLKWYVLYHNSNSNEIELFNIFNSSRFSECVAEALVDYTDYNKFVLDIKSGLIYSFMSKAEYEIICSGLFANNENDFYKIDIYNQVEENIPILAKYIFDEYNKTRRVKLIGDER